MTDSKLARERVAKLLGEGEFFVNGDTFDLVFRPGGGCYSGADVIVARMACGETAYCLPGFVAELLNAALQAPAVGDGVDSGMSGDAVERAEWAWANLPVGPRRWTSLTTAEKALACHIFTALSQPRAPDEELVDAWNAVESEAKQLWYSNLKIEEYVRPDWDEITEKERDKWRMMALRELRGYTTALSQPNAIEQARKETFKEAAKVAIHHSNFGHVEGNRRAFLIARDLERRAQAILSDTKEGE